MRMGMPTPTPTPTLPRRHSTEHAPRLRSLFPDSDDALDPADFADVFGGPPRSVLWRKLSGDFNDSSASAFYEEIFRPPDFGTPSIYGGRSLSAFRIPATTSDVFYSDVFASDDDHRLSRERSRPNSKAKSKSKSKSKSNSSSVLSSEELSPLRPLFGDDVALSSFASKLRYVDVSRTSSSTTPAGRVSVVLK